MAHDGDVERAAEAVPVSRVSGRVRTAGGTTPGRPPSAGDVPLTIAVPRIVRWLAVLGMLSAFVLTLVFQDVRWGLLGGASLVGGIVLRRTSGRVSFSYGDGFLPYRAELGWPRGVQEDDDIHWTWADAGRP